MNHQQMKHWFICSFIVICIVSIYLLSYEPLNKYEVRLLLANSAIFATSTYAPN